MSWAVPEYSRRQVNAAGVAYIEADTPDEERELARAVINNWRSSHSYPLNALQINLRNIVRNRDTSPTVAQRIKRLPSIRHKLQRMPNMNLAQMQDLGGCRAVLSSVEAVEKVAAWYTTHSRAKHRLKRHDPYIEHPKPSGYRGIHLIYAYQSDTKPVYNGLKIEIQLRSRLQHAWATAVETVGTFTQQALKSSWGEAGWLRFFALMSSAIAIREGTPPVPGTPDDPIQLQAELRNYVRALNVIDRLRAYGEALRLAEQGAMEGHTYLLELDIATKSLVARSYGNSAVASESYSALELAVEGNPDKDVVLVTVDSLSSLRSAFPNYFLDTSVFLSAVEEAVAD